MNHFKHGAKGMYNKFIEEIDLKWAQSVLFGMNMNLMMSICVGIFSAGMGVVSSAVSPYARNTLPMIGSSTRAVNMSGETAKFVKEAINKDSVVIFSKTYCPYCKMAKEVFDKLHHAFTAIELDQRDDGDSIQDVLGEITGAKTVPRVFVNGAFVGGGSDVKSLYEAGKLEKMLVTAAN